MFGGIEDEGVQRRYQYLKHVSQEKGLRRIRQFTEDSCDPVKAAVMDGIVDSLEGVDVWSDTFATFGKLWVQTFPFTATFVSDMGGKAGKDHAFLHVGSEGAYMHTCIYSLLRALKNKKNKTKIGLMIMTMTNIFFRITHE